VTNWNLLRFSRTGSDIKAFFVVTTVACLHTPGSTLVNITLTFFSLQQFEETVMRDDQPTCKGSPQRHDLTAT
jgi:hypothetical protein